MTPGWRAPGTVRTVVGMTEPEEKPRSAPAGLKGDAKEERSPPAEPGGRGSERSQGAAGEEPEEGAGGGVYQDPDVDRALD